MILYRISTLQVNIIYMCEAWLVSLAIVEVYYFIKVFTLTRGIGLLYLYKFTLELQDKFYYETKLTKQKEIWN